MGCFSSKSGCIARVENDEISHQLQPKKNKVRLYYPFIQQQKKFQLPFIANKTERVSFKNGCVVRLTKHCNGVLRLQLWLKTTLYRC